MAETISSNSGPITLTSANPGYNPLTILSGVTVSGPTDGVQGDNSQAWTVANYGTIAGVSGSGVYLAAGGVVTNSSAALISGGVNGVFAGTSASTISNQGTLIGTTGAGVYLQAGGSVINIGTAASISGAKYGIDVATGAATVTNQGSISGGTVAVQFASGGGNVFVLYPGAVTTGYVNAGSGLNTLALASSLSIGTITGIGSQYVGFRVVNVEAGASWLAADGNTILGSAKIYVDASATLTNAGTLGAAVTLDAGASLTNTSAGTVAAGYGVIAPGNAVTVTNEGVISGATGHGIELLAGGTVINSSVTASLSGSLDGVYAYSDLGSASATAITNLGTISGAIDGVFLGPGGTVTNAGSIHGGSNAVEFAPHYTSRLIIDPGAVFSGVVDGGNAVGAPVVSSLELASGASAGTLAGLGSQYIDFGQTTIDAGASWTLTGSNSLASGATLTNAGTLDLSNATLTDNGVLENDGIILLDPSTMTVGSLIGTGNIIIGAGSTLDAQGTVASGEAIAFGGSGAYLHLDMPDYVSGSVTNFAVGKSIDLSGVAAGSVTLASGTLSFTGGSFALSLDGVTEVQAVTSADGALVSALCFCAGTQILTPSGEVPVETLSVGDPVVTASGIVERVVWIGTGKVMVARGRRSAATPVIVRKGALADNVPNRDLRVTKGHSLFLDGVLIPVEFLINHRSIVWDDLAQEVTIYHVELARHDVLVANGAPAESYRDDGNRWLFQNANSGWEQPPSKPCAPILTGGPVVDAIWLRLLERAGPRTGLPLTDEADLHLLVDGKRIDAIEQRDAMFVFRLRGKPRSVRIRSRAAVPQELGLSRDPRCLGVAVRRLVLAEARRQRAIEAGAVSLTDGYHGFEASDGIRWTDGDAVVPAELFAGMSGPGMLMVQLGGATRYVAEGAICRAA